MVATRAACFNPVALDWQVGFDTVSVVRSACCRLSFPYHRFQGSTAMTRHVRSILMLLVSGTLLVANLNGLVAADKPPPRHVMTLTDIERQLKELSNWNRWGDGDELGSLNLMTPRTRRRAAKLVKRGVTVSLARVAEETKAVDNPDPFEQKMLKIGRTPGVPWAVDSYSVNYHGYAHTHIDSLCHLFFRGRLYNGFTHEDVTEKGARRLSIHNLRHGIFARGVLVDIPRLRGKKWLEPAEAVYPEDLDAWEKKADIKIGRGDIVFFRTGRWARRDAKGPWDVKAVGMPGLHASCCAWLKKRDIAMVGSDAAMDVMPSQIEGITHPVHLLLLHAMGCHIFDNCDLEDLGNSCAEYRRWEFLLTASPIPVRGGTGSPLNPIAGF